MTIQEMFELIETPAPLAPPESLFMARSKSGEVLTFCVASFVHKGEWASMIAQYPDLPSWEVIKPFSGFARKRLYTLQIIQSATGMNWSERDGIWMNWMQEYGVTDDSIHRFLEDNPLPINPNLA